jgi:RNA polymerase sigma-70 factor (ECF subfamily)
MPHLQAAYRLSYALLRSRVEAEDAVQDSYLRAFRAIAQFRGDDFKPWFLTIVRNVCYRQLQNRRRSFNVISLDQGLTGDGEEDAQALDVASDAPTPEEALARAQEHVQLHRALAQLPAGLGEILHLREIEELSYQDIASMLGIPMGTVMSRLSRAREKLAALVLGNAPRSAKNAL